MAEEMPFSSSTSNIRMALAPFSVSRRHLTRKIRVQSSEFRVQSSDNEIIVINKSDLLKTKPNKNAIYVSAKTRNGIDKLLDIIRTQLHKLTDGFESALVINARTKVLLETARDELKSAIAIGDKNYDLISEHVRAAADAIGKILGRITASDVMDATFSQLCLGK